ncbi:unnamed protein product [Pieris macdunnoughi]|uniref:SEFIR domain-containing protein n=1 Tax=Pieris macdunnoughi TaxID=345717 RepID=A0A821XYX8_9NEOP|nr:unnamed protein product [Pieris macdunnoughi]
MIITVLVLVLLNGFLSYAEYVTINCSNHSESNLTFVPSKDVAGRYNINWCTESDKEVTSWELTLRYIENRSENECQYSLMMRGPQHSFFRRRLNMDLNCTNVCFSTSLDLIFNGTCYHIKTLLHHGNNSTSPSDYVFYAKNEFSKQHFTDSQSPVNTQSNGEHLTVHWFLSYIPASEYSMDLFGDSTGQLPKDVTDNCTVVGRRQTEIVCSLWVPYGDYRMGLHHLAPWTTGSIFNSITNREYSFEHKPENPVPVTHNNSGLLWISCGALAFVLTLTVALVLICRRIESKRVWMQWIMQSVWKRNSPGMCRGRIVLVYARDCPHVMRLAAALRTLLARVTDDPVYDVYCPERWSVVAGAAGEWMRRAVTSPDTRLVLLQTPALQHLHRATGDLTPEHPLLGSVAVYRQPHGADELVTLALRLLNETAHRTVQYRKFYKITVSGLEVDVVPTVTPYRSYQLPQDALVLLRDLDPSFFPTDSDQPPNEENRFSNEAPLNRLPSVEAPQSPPENPELNKELQVLQEAASELVAYVRENPAYLTEQLFFI